MVIQKGKQISFQRHGALPAVQTDLYETLVRGNFSPSQLRLHVQGGRKSYPAEVQESIEKAWASAVNHAGETGQLLFNGKLFSLLEYGISEGALNLLLGETDYKELVGTNCTLPESKCPDGENLLSNGMAVCTTIVTDDEQLILGRRSQKVHGGSGMLHVCAGHPDPEEVLTVEALLMVENLFFRAMKREIMEELRIGEDQIEKMTCLGLIRSRETLKPEVLFHTSVMLTAKEVLKSFNSAEDKDEHEEMITLPAEEASLVKFLEAHAEEFTAPGLATVIFWGIEKGFWVEAVG